MSKPIEVALSAVAAVALAIGLAAVWPQAAQAQNIIEEWDSIKAPPPPIDKIKPVQIDPKKTALFSLDWNSRTCTAEARVRCFKTLPKIEKLLAEARSRNMLVVHALSGSMKPTDHRGQRRAERRRAGCARPRRQVLRQRSGEDAEG